MSKVQLGITFGCWDLLHAGHVHLLKFAQSRCEMLVVGLHVDPSIEHPEKHRPIQTVYERFIQLAAVLRKTDRIVPYETEKDLERILQMMEFNQRYLGSDYGPDGYNIRSITGADICRERETEMIFIDRSHGFSTSELRTRIFDAEINKLTS